MKRKYFFLSISLLAFQISFAQSFAIDGKFNDWSNYANFIDPVGDGNVIDLTGYSLANDDENLYIKLIARKPFNLADSNSLYLNIDADNDTATGYKINGIGADLSWRFGSRYGFYYHGTYKDTVFANDIKFVAMPTFKSDTFEIAISRSALVGIIPTPLFTSPRIKVNFNDGVSGGDFMPNWGVNRALIFYTTIHSDFGPIDVTKCNPNYIRLMEYNVMLDGLSDTSTRLNNFQRIFKAINPDIIVLNECTYTTTYTQVKNLLNTWLPNTTSWNCYKVDGGNIICSRFPVLDARNISFRKATAAYIQLPSPYLTNLLVIGTHMYPSNDGDTVRQREADVIAAYIRDMKAGTTAYKIPTNTPFLIAGDLNMVNNPSSLNTLLTGNIINTSLYGTAPLPDWNNAPLTSNTAYIADRNMAYTWRNQNPKAKWWPGKLDYVIHSNTNLKIKKSFVLQTEMMSAARLTQYGLLATDNLIASDHLPTVVDIEIPTTPIITPTVSWNGSINTAWENPANWDCSMVPDSNSNVIIPSVAPHFPIVNNSTEIRSIHSNSGSSLIVQPSVQFKLNGF